MQSYNLTNVNILILEHNKLIRRLMSGVCRELGIEKGKAVGNTDEAFDMFASNTPDLIISDWSPSLDGIEFIRRIRSAPESPNPFVPVIVCSGNTEKRHVLTARDAGMTEYLAKPVSAKAIYSRFVAVIEQQRTFVRSANYIGPDRRRRAGTAWAREERRQAKIKAKARVTRI